MRAQKKENVVACGGSLIFLFEQWEQKLKVCGHTTVKLCEAWIFLVWHHASGLTSPKEEPGKNSMVFDSNELGDARDMLMFVEQI